jgi:hypothetical protein
MLTRAIENMWHKIKTEPPIACAAITIVFFSLPVIVTIVANGSILLPSGFTYTSFVSPFYGIVAIIFNILLLYLFSKSPIIKLNFHSIITPDFIRKFFILFYIGISWFSFYIINAKINFISSLIADPLLTILSVGSDLVEEKLLASFFFGISGCIGYALISKHDGIFIRALSFITMLVIVTFYFFVGRREISLMTLCFLLLTRRNKISRTYLIIVGILSAVILIFILSLRLSLQDNNSSAFATDSEELSPIAYSAYVIRHSTPDIIRSFIEVTPVRSKLFPTTISAAYLKEQSGYNDVANPVLGIAGITYMYGFIVPIFMMLVIGIIVRSITNEFNIKKTPVLKVLLIFMSFKSINLFRNGEFPIVMIDVILFFCLCLPVLFLKFKENN